MTATLRKPAMLIFTMATKFVCLLLFISLLTPQVYASGSDSIFEASAQCVAQVNRCDKKTARESINCLPNTFVKKQSKACRNAGCKYCSWPSSRQDAICFSWSIRYWCASFFKTNNKPRQSKSPSPSTNPKPEGGFKFKNPFKCLWKGRNNTLAIDIKYVSPWGKWTKNGDGLKWAAQRERGTDKRGSGEMCFNFVVPSNGNYYLTALTLGAHFTDHNDMWIKLAAGIRLYRGKTDVYRKTERKYMKAYQNQGKSKISNILSSVNYKPHYFVTEMLSSKKSEMVCIAGRSSKFTVYKLVFVKCSLGHNCNRWKSFIRNAMDYLAEPICT